MTERHLVVEQGNSQGQQEARTRFYRSELRIQTRSCRITLQGNAAALHMRLLSPVGLPHKAYRCHSFSAQYHASFIM